MPRNSSTCLRPASALGAKETFDGREIVVGQAMKDTDGGLRAVGVRRRSAAATGVAVAVAVAVGWPWRRGWPSGWAPAEQSTVTGLEAEAVWPAESITTAV